MTEAVHRCLNSSLDNPFDAQLVHIDAFGKLVCHQTVLIIYFFIYFDIMGLHNQLFQSQQVVVLHIQLGPQILVEIFNSMRRTISKPASPFIQNLRNRYSMTVRKAISYQVILELEMVRLRVTCFYNTIFFIIHKPAV